MRRQIEFEARRIGLQRTVGVDDARCLEERAHHAAHLAVLVPCQYRLAIEPADLQPVTAAQAGQILYRQWEAPLTDAVGGAFEIGEVVARDLLMRADQQMGELSAT